MIRNVKHRVDPGEYTVACLPFSKLLDALGNGGDTEFIVNITGIKFNSDHDPKIYIDETKPWATNRYWSQEYQGFTFWDALDSIAWAQMMQYFNGIAVHALQLSERDVQQLATAAGATLMVTLSKKLAMETVLKTFPKSPEDDPYDLFEWRWYENQEYKQVRDKIENGWTLLGHKIGPDDCELRTRGGSGMYMRR